MKASLFRLAAACCLGLSLSAPAVAQDYPAQLLKWIVPYAAGGGSDVTARVVSNTIKDSLGQNIIIENKPGGGTIVGMQSLLTAKPDGYSVATADSGTLAYNPSLYANLPYDIDKSFSYVGGLARMPLVLVTRQDLAVKSLAELLDLARQQPGKLTYGSAGAGSPHHVAMEMFQQETGTKLIHIPYKGAAPAVQDLLSGQVDLMMLDMPGGIAHMKGGKLRLLAVAMPERVQQLPDVPTMGEAGLPDFVAFAWQGLVAPAGTPPEALRRLDADLRKAMESPVVRDKLTELGTVPMPMSGEEFGRYARSERDRWAKVIKAAGIKLD